MSDSQAVVIAATLDRFREIARRYQQNQQWLDERYREIETVQAEQNTLSEQARRCYVTADLFGFDLAAELAAAQDGGTTINAETLVREVATDPKPPTVKEFVLEQARLAFPQSIRAAQVRRALKDQLGTEVHEKTVGMTLYRLSKEGSIRREGAADWFYVPEEHRVTPPPSSGDEDQDWAADAK
ncbi:MAG: hypothetical protein ABL864_13425 [Terricaulis sp.]